MSDITGLAVLFHIGPVPIAGIVVVTWAIMLIMVLGGALLAARLQRVPSRTQAALEAVVGAVDSQIREVLKRDPAPYRGFAGTLFTFILVANWSSIIPGVEPPTARLETDAALALVVFIAVVVFGIRASGVTGYFRHFASPSVFLIPLNLLETLTRSFSLLVRLFGNVMSGVVLIGVVASLARLFVPIPLMALDLLTGAIQAYIFSILALVFVADAVGDGDRAPAGKGEDS
jgi:F-type H+-transporting ATPase subunit a